MSIIYQSISSIEKLSAYNGKYIKFTCTNCKSVDKSQVFLYKDRFNFGLLCLSCYKKAKDDYYKANPTLVNHITDFENMSILQGQYIKYFCKSCKVENIQKFSNTVLNRLKETDLLCQKCKLATKSAIRHNYKEIDINKPIYVESTEDFLSRNYKYKQKIAYTCKCCKKETIMIYRNDHRDSYSDLLCPTCKVKDRIKQKYGVENVFALEETKQKIKDTCLEKYGTEYAMQADCNKEKLKKTLIEKYGVENPSLCPDIVAKRTQTFIERYGKTCPPRTQIRNIFDDIQFDSSWEIIFYKYHKYVLKDDIQREPCSIPYYYNSKRYNYYPDFKINNVLYEIKGDHLLEKMKEPGTKSHEKYLCMLQNNVVIITLKDIKVLKSKLASWEKSNSY